MKRMRVSVRHMENKPRRLEPYILRIPRRENRANRNEQLLEK
jgi:hypothetical protein